MTLSQQRWLRALAGAAMLSLAACGGNGDGAGEPVATVPVTGSGGEPSSPTAFTVSGVAATGAAFAGATVTLYDKAGVAVGSQTVGDDGRFSFTLPPETQAPFVIEAVREDQTLVSMFAQLTNTNLNVTPLTTLIAARLAPDGNPATLRMNAAALTPERIAATLAEVVALIRPLLAAVSDTTDPLTGVFAANGSGHDKVLDSLSIAIRPSGDRSNIEVAVRSAADDPPKAIFTSKDPAPAPLAGTVAVTDLAGDGLPRLLADLTGRLTACYALPLASRVDNTTSTATAANVVAPACRSLFIGDDPAGYRNNGATVAASGAFAGLFREGGTNLVFERPMLEFLRNNAEKDVVFSYRSKDAAGNVFNETLTARQVGTALKLIGNQYQFSVRLRPIVQDREYLNQPSSTFQSVGYNVAITNVQSNGNPIFAKAVVTTPRGNVLTYRPLGGRSSLVIAREDGSLTGTSVIRLAARFTDPATSETPSQFEPALFFANPALSDDELRAIPEKGTWRVEFFFADPGRPNVVQLHRTISRAPTLAEAAVLRFAELTPQVKAEIRAKTATSQRFTFDTPSAGNPNVANVSADNGDDGWVVPSGAASPTSVTVFGRGPGRTVNGMFTQGALFDDSVNVSPSARKAVIRCTPLGQADNHCDSSTGTLQYAAGTSITSIELFAVSSRFVELSKLSATYRLARP